MRLRRYDARYEACELGRCQFAAASCRVAPIDCPCQALVHLAVLLCKIWDFLTTWTARLRARRGCPPTGDLIGTRSESLQANPRHVRARCVCARVHQSHDFPAAVNAELAVDRLGVRLDGGVGDAERLLDLGRRHVAGEQPQDLLFAARETGFARKGCAALLERRPALRTKRGRRVEPDAPRGVVPPRPRASAVNPSPSRTASAMTSRANPSPPSIPDRCVSQLPAKYIAENLQGRRARRVSGAKLVGGLASRRRGRPRECGRPSDRVLGGDGLP